LQKNDCLMIVMSYLTQAVILEVDLNCIFINS
jgi:hypothetical protein